MSKLWMAMMLAGCAMALPAHAADVATLSCLDQKLGDKGAGLVAGQVSEIMGNIESEADTPANDETSQAIGAALKACADQYHWSEKATLAAAMYAAPHLGWGTASAIARKRGLDPAAIEREFNALTQDQRLAIVSADYSFVESAITGLAMKLLAAGEIKDDNATVAGGLIGLLALRERAVHNFAEG